MSTPIVWWAWRRPGVLEELPGAKKLGLLVPTPLAPRERLVQTLMASRGTPMRLRLLTLYILVFSLTACSLLQSPEPEAPRCFRHSECPLGTQCEDGRCVSPDFDAGEVADGGLRTDAGEPSDAGRPADGGVLADAGSSSDGGPQSDGGGLRDGGVSPDRAPVPDATAAEDGGQGFDAAAVPDAGAPLERCGNGRVEAGEACDDGNGVNTDACLNDCIEASCGDGIVHDGAEECDDGNGELGDGCEDCRVACPGSVLGMARSPEDVRFCFMDSRLSWEEARLSCASGAMNLVHIESQAVNDWLAWVTIGLAWDTREFWTGGREDQGLHWVSGDPFNYVNWRPGQPDGEDEHCIMFDPRPAADGQWADVDCEQLFHYVCRE